MKFVSCLGTDVTPGLGPPWPTGFTLPGSWVSLSGDQAEINPAKTNARAQGQLVGRPGEKDQPELETPQGRPSAR